MLTFMNRKKSQPCSAELSMKRFYNLEARSSCYYCHVVGDFKDSLKMLKVLREANVSFICNEFTSYDYVAILILINALSLMI